MEKEFNSVQEQMRKEGVDVYDGFSAAMKDLLTAMTAHAKGASREELSQYLGRTLISLIGIGEMLDINIPDAADRAARGFQEMLKESDY